MTTATQTLGQTLGQTQASAIPAIIGAGALGLFLLFFAVFAQGAVFHDSAHDVRHATGFACH